MSAVTANQLKESFPPGKSGAGGVEPGPGTVATAKSLTLSETLRRDWPLFLIEGFLLGCFMVSATAATVLMDAPNSPVAHIVSSPILRRVVIGAAMGGTAVILIYCPWGKRSGAHFNPAFTLSFLWLGKIKAYDALGYVIGQFVGGTLGVLYSALVFGSVVQDPSVRYVVTVPGIWGIGGAWGGEFVISFILVATVLLLNKFPKLVKLTGVFIGILIMVFVTIEVPLSGFSMNPARTFSSAIVADIWTGWWIYYTAPVLGMLAAVEVHRLFEPDPSRLCLRLNHSTTIPTLHPCHCLPGTSVDGPDFDSTT